MQKKRIIILILFLLFRIEISNESFLIISPFFFFSIFSELPDHADWVEMMYDKTISMNVKGVMRDVQYRLQYLYNTRTHSVIATNERAWSDTSMMCLWLEMVVNPFAERNEQRVFLVVDNCGSHTTAGVEKVRSLSLFKVFEFGGFPFLLCFLVPFSFRFFFLAHNDTTFLLFSFFVSAFHYNFFTNLFLSFSPACFSGA